MNRREILTRDAKRVGKLIGGILFPASWIAEKLLYLWWLWMERDLERSEDQSRYKNWRGAFSQTRATSLVAVTSLMCGVACVVIWWIVFLPAAALENNPWDGAWLAIWAACFFGNFARIFTALLLQGIFPSH